MKKLLLAVVLAVVLLPVSAVDCLDSDYKGVCVVGKASKVNCDPYGKANAAIESASAKAGIEPALLCALIRAESTFNPRARSGKGAAGYTQLLPSTASSACGLRGERVYDAAANIECGARYLRAQLDRFKDERLALAAYNAGPGAVRKYGGVPPFKETQGYVKRVLAYCDAYRKQMAA